MLVTAKTESLHRNRYENQFPDSRDYVFTHFYRVAPISRTGFRGWLFAIGYWNGDTFKTGTIEWDEKREKYQNEECI